MKEQHESWMEAFARLGEALIRVLRAEIEVLADGWKRSGRQMAIALGLFGAAVIVIVWLPPLMIAAVVFALHELLEWSMWGSSIAVGALVVVVAGILTAAARWVVVRRVENPVTLLGRRIDDHVVWWRESLLGEGRELRIEGDDDGQADVD